MTLKNDLEDEVGKLLQDIEGASGVDLRTLPDQAAAEVVETALRSYMDGFLDSARQLGEICASAAPIETHLIVNTNAELLAAAQTLDDPAGVAFLLGTGINPPAGSTIALQQAHDQDLNLAPVMPLPSAQQPGDITLLTAVELGRLSGEMDAAQQTGSAIGSFNSNEAHSLADAVETAPQTEGLLHVVEFTHWLRLSGEVGDTLRDPFDQGI